ncbi:YceK/YidQ family lipoprotein, partial [Salmonella enterica subsp. enterica serovar Enteritidis]|nr:YceK/YidQ family lipoprotein [Salmonella enterica subsp. enterica serovar Enteritidis]
QGYYSGAKNDVKMLKHEDTGWAMTPLLALDLPLSAVVDTLLLPYDYYRSDSNPEDESPRARVLRNEQASGVNNIAPSH